MIKQSLADRVAVELGQSSELVAEVRALEADIERAFERGLAAVTAIRCVEHRDVPRYNKAVNESECAACVVIPRQALLISIYRSWYPISYEDQLDTALKAGRM